MITRAPTGFERISPLVLALKWFLALRLWVALCVTMLSIYCMRVLTESSPFQLGDATLAAIFFSTLALYNLDRSLDRKRHSRGSETSRRIESSDNLPGPSRRHHLVLSLGAIAVLFMCLPGLNLASLTLLGLGFFLCSLYAVPWGRETKRRAIKSIPGVKAPFVGFAVAIAVVWVPLAPHFAPLSMLPSAHFLSSSPCEATVLTLTLALLCTVNALLFDVPDVDEDRENEVPTAALRWGVRHNRHLCVLLCLVAAGLALRGLTRPLPVIAMAAYLTLAASRINEDTGKTTITFWVDGGLIVPLGVQLLSSLR